MRNFAKETRQKQSFIKQVVLVGSGSIGQAIARRVAACRHVVLADYSEKNVQIAAKTLENAGFECSTIRVNYVEPYSFHQRYRHIY